jgi:hypothetical protein
MMPGAKPIANDGQLAVLRPLVARRRALGEEHSRKVAQLHQLLLELIPGGVKKFLSAVQAKALLAPCARGTSFGGPGAGAVRL